MKPVRFPIKTIKLMAKLGLSEATVKDVFRAGEYIKEKEAIVKKYQGYEIGLFFAKDKETGDYVITHVWKRDRR